MNDSLALFLKYMHSGRLTHFDTLGNHIILVSTTSANESSLLSNVLTILLALLAGLIALYQVKSNTIANSRISWIENLRISISDYCVETLDSITLLKNAIHQRQRLDSSHQAFITAYNNYFECSSKAEKLAYKCKLLLNSKEETHNQILELIEKNQLLLDVKDVDLIEIDLVRKDIDEIIVLAKLVFKEEWGKSKRIFKI